MTSKERQEKINRTFSCFIEKRWRFLLWSCHFEKNKKNKRSNYLSPSNGTSHCKHNCGQKNNYQQIVNFFQSDHRWIRNRSWHAIIHISWWWEEDAISCCCLIHDRKLLWNEADLERMPLLVLDLRQKLKIVMRRRRVMGIWMIMFGKNVRIFLWEWCVEDEDTKDYDEDDDETDASDEIKVIWRNFPFLSWLLYLWEIWGEGTWGGGEKRKIQLKWGTKSATSGYEVDFSLDSQSLL